MLSSLASTTLFPLDPWCHLHMLCIYVATFRWPKDVLGLGSGDISKNKPKHTELSVLVTYITVMRSDKKLKCLELHGISTFQCLCLWKVLMHFLEIWSKYYPVWKREKEGWVLKTQIIKNLKVIYKGCFKSFVALYADRICSDQHFVENRIEKFLFV